MSFAPKDGHENQIQFALERGIGAMISAIATKQLPYPTSSFEMVHCSRCRVDWHGNDGVLLKEVNRLLRSNGYFIYSGPPAYRKDKEYPLIWDKLVNLTTAMCWKLISRKVQTAVWIKEENESCLLQNAEQKLLKICEVVDDSKTSWNVPLRNCVQVRSAAADSLKLPPRPERLSVFSESLSKLDISQEEFTSRHTVWQDQIRRYWRLMNINETEIRNNTLSAIYDRGLIGAFHDWCEPFSSYPRSYDLLHANHLFPHYRRRGPGCLLEDIMLEMDRLTRPQGFIIIRDDKSIVSRIQQLAPKFLWEVKSHLLENKEKKMETVLICRKKFWAIV
ncbi:S-adenosyl-L-methionine-dependent methyltransferases superfamily protein [Quillaja saponaria]|uniref:Methyltransferase n=1 Tax=Quillaja saponaria TaxID=32244 RepID=A0AAD7Q857_QUISA|nr:S-adenosyl-L-methionine-dependent methyltransferases superfamily protein [Quillaja saponaria]